MSIIDETHHAWERLLHSEEEAATAAEAAAAAAATEEPTSAKKPPVFPGLKRQLSIPKLTELGKDASVASDKAMVKKMSEDNLSALNAEPEVKRIVA